MVVMKSQSEGACGELGQCFDPYLQVSLEGRRGSITALQLGSAFTHIVMAPLGLLLVCPYFLRI